MTMWSFKYGKKNGTRIRICIWKIIHPNTQIRHSVEKSSWLTSSCNSRLICYYNHDMLTHRSKCKDIPLNIVVSSWIHLVLLLQTDVVVWYAVFLEQAFTKLHMQIRAGHSSLHRWLLL